MNLLSKESHFYIIITNFVVGSSLNIGIVCVYVESIIFNYKIWNFICSRVNKKGVQET